MKNENNYLTHGIHPYHAKFIPAIPKEFLEKYAEEGDLILDPFCGSGTTLLECMLNNRKSIGVDLNVVAYMISKAKTTIPDINKLKAYYSQVTTNLEKEEIKNPIIFDNKDIWYEANISETMDKLISRIKKIPEEDYKNIFLVILSSIAKTVSNKRETWNNGYIADNVLPNKKYNGDVIKVFNKKYIEVEKSYEDLIDKTKNQKIYKPQIYNKDILEYTTNKKIDAVITSPPYPFAVDFVKYNRLSCYWLELDVDDLSEKETGARTKRNRKDASNQFFIEMEKIYLHIFKLIKVNGYFCMTVANTKRKNEEICFVEWLDKLFLSNGWENVQNEKRTLENQSMAQKRIPQENKLVYRKVKDV